MNSVALNAANVAAGAQKVKVDRILDNSARIDEPSRSTDGPSCASPSIDPQPPSGACYHTCASSKTDSPGTTKVSHRSKEKKDRTRKPKKKSAWEKINDRVRLGLELEKKGDRSVQSGNIQFGLREYDEALDYLRNTNHGEDAARVLRSAGDVLREHGFLSLALEYYEEALQLSLHDNTAMMQCIAKLIGARENLGSRALTERRHGEALVQYGEIARLAKNCLRGSGKAAPIDMHRAQATIAQILLEMSDFKKGLDLLTKTLCEYEEDFGCKEEHDTKLIEICSKIVAGFQTRFKAREDFAAPGIICELGSICSSIALYDIASDFFHRAFQAEKSKKCDVENSNVTLLAIRGIGLTSVATKDFQSALSHFSEYISLSKNSYGDEAAVLNTMGVIHCAQNDLKRAVSSYSQAVAMQNDSGAVCGIMDSVVSTFSKSVLSSSDDSSTWHERCKTEGGDLYHVKEILLNFGIAQLTLGCTKSNKDYLRMVKRCTKDSAACTNGSVSWVLKSSGDFFFVDQRDYATAILFYEKCLERHKSTRKKSGKDIIEVLANLATAYLKVRQYNKSMSASKRASEVIRHQKAGKRRRRKHRDHPGKIRARRIIGHVLSREGNDEFEQEMFEDVIRNKLETMLE